MSFSTRPTPPGIARLRASRTRRRGNAALLALAMLAATVLMGVISFNVGTTLTLTALLPVFLVLMVVLLVVNTRLAMAMGMGSYRKLDERQRAELDRATRTGHHVTTGLIMAAFLVAVVLVAFTPESVSFPQELFMPVLWVILMAHVSIPNLYLAWTQPDEIPEDEEL